MMSDFCFLIFFSSLSNCPCGSFENSTHPIFPDIKYVYVEHETERIKKMKNRQQWEYKNLAFYFCCVLYAMNMSKFTEYFFFTEIQTLYNETLMIDRFFSSSWKTGLRIFTVLDNLT